MTTFATSRALYLGRVAALEPLIRENIAWSQRERRLAPAVVEAFHEAGLFRMLLSGEFGGGGLSEIEAVPVIEAVARIDASAAWNVMIAQSSAGYLRGFPDAVASEVLSGPRSLLAGVINPHTIRLRAVEGGYVVSGRGPFASGCWQATWFGAGGILTNPEAASASGHGPVVLLAVMPAEQGEILDSWRVSGLRGTGSHDLLFEDVFVPTAHVTNLDNVPSTRAGAAIAAVAIGASRHAIDEFRALAVGKVAFGTGNKVRDRADAQISLARATGLVEAAHALVTGYLTEIPDRVAGGEALPLEQQALLRLSCVMATELSVEAADLVHTAAGSSTLPEDSVIGLCWRDIHAVLQNISVQQKHYQWIGQILLGVEPSGTV